MKLLSTKRAYLIAVTATLVLGLCLALRCLDRSPVTETMCTLPGTRGTGSGSCADMVQFPEAAYHLNQISKQSIILEDELTDPARPCQYCGNFFRNIVSLARHGADNATDPSARPLLVNVETAYREAHDRWMAGEDPVRIAEGIRAVRKQTMERFLV
nr:hypothetical protein TetV2_00472 [Oceanusvirus sp.]